jgi:hypothetical protein
VGCPRSKPGTYWRLIRSLYGLKRAPRLWYEKLSSHLRAMGLKQSSISPCLFVGTLIDGQPPVYVEIYVTMQSILVYRMMLRESLRRDYPP